MKKIIIIILSIYICLCSAGSLHAFLISDAYWNKISGTGANKILPIQIKAAAAATGYAYMLGSAGLAAFVADLSLAEAFYNDDAYMKSLLQSAVSASSETWTKDQTKKKFVSDKVQPGPNGEYVEVPANFYTAFGNSFYNMSTFRLLLNPSWNDTYDMLIATYRKYYYYYAGDAYEDMTYELDNTNENSTYWQLLNSQCGYDPCPYDSCTCSSDGIIHSGSAMLLNNYVFSSSYLAPFITEYNSKGYKVYYYYVAVREQFVTGGQTYERWWVIWSFYASTENGPTYDVNVESVSASMTDNVPDNLSSQVSSTYTDFFSNPSNAYRNQAAYGNAADTTYNQVNNYTTTYVSNYVNETVNNNYYASENNTTVISQQGDLQGEQQGSSGTFTGGSYSQQRAGSAFEPSYDDFGTLFSDFMTSMKATSLFSMPGELMSNLPTSEVCTYQLDCGSYGIHTISFCDWSTALLIFKAIVLIVFSTWALRIVILKG